MMEEGLQVTIELVRIRQNMGQRANLVILQHGEWCLYYDHWCANRLDVELFWGPRNATAFVEQRKALADRDDWLDDVWCEGGALLDHDRHLLLWYGGEDILDDIPLRRAHLSLMALQWEGWQICWASGSIAELGAYLGYAMEKFIARRQADDADEFRQIKQYAEDNNFLLTVQAQGVTTATRLYGDEVALELGAKKLEKLLAFPRDPVLEWADHMPSGGLHLNLDTRELFYWFANPSIALESRIAHTWPGWQCHYLGDQYEKHLDLATGVEIRLPQRDPLALQRCVIDHVRHCCTRVASNPARELLPKLGQDAQVNPWTDEGRGSFGVEPEKIVILDALQKRLPI